MDLIYADVIDGVIYDQGTLNVYDYDCSFGEKENNFQIKAPMGATELKENQVVYIMGTEYGGVIDAIEVDTTNRFMIYTGRTWHGILENKILYPLPGHDYFYVNGDANEVLRELLERMNIIPGELNELYVQPAEGFMSVSSAESGIYVEARVASESGNYAHGYTFIRDLLYAFNAKPRIINGVLSAVENIDYSNDDDFLEGTDQFRAKRNYNSLNRLHCMGSGNLSDRYTIDLYLDENGGLLPYSRTNPVKDSDYYTDLNALSQSTDPEDVANFQEITEHMVTGINEISDIYDYPSIQNTYHYVELQEQPEDWETDLTPSEELKDKKWGFQNYFEQKVDSNTENVNYNALAKPGLETGYRLQLTMPGDWISNFADYFTSGADGFTPVQAVEYYVQQNTEPADWYQGGYANYFLDTAGTPVAQIPGLTPLTSPPGDWSTNWTAYALSDGSRVPSVTPDPIPSLLGTQPGDWSNNYASYYTTDGVNFTPVAGVTKKRKKLTTYQPSDWAKNYKTYWKHVGGKWVHPTNKKAPKWKSGTYYMEESYQVPPKFKKNMYYSLTQPPDQAPQFQLGLYFANGYVVPTWGWHVVYKKQTVPTWTKNTYYTAYDYQPIPTFVPGYFYIKYEDHFEALIESALKKIAEYQKKDELAITLDESRVYDINDRVGASDEVTGIGAVERITQKIVKIQRGIVTFSYDTGK